MPTAFICHFGACLHSVVVCFIALKSAPYCKQHVFISCVAHIFLTVTPFGVCFTCILIRFLCTLCWCHFFLLLTNLNYGLGQISTKSFNRCGHLVLCMF